MIHDLNHICVRQIVTTISVVGLIAI